MFWKGLFWLQSQAPSPWMTFSPSLILTGRHRILSCKQSPAVSGLVAEAESLPPSPQATLLLCRLGSRILDNFSYCCPAKMPYSVRNPSQGEVLWPHTSQTNQVCPAPWFPIAWHEADVPSPWLQVGSRAGYWQQPWKTRLHGNRAMELQPTVPPTTLEERGTCGSAKTNHVLLLGSKGNQSLYVNSLWPAECSIELKGMAH